VSHRNGDSYRDEIAAALSGGWRFAGLHVADGRRCVRVILVAPGGEVRVETVVINSGVVPSIVDIAPAANWDEREAHDLFGVGFDGHEPLRPLVEHDPTLAHWTARVRGHEPYQVAVGPIHAGLIESGHFRFQVVGDRILHLDARVFYKHRGLERAATGTTLEKGAAYIARACGACAVANGIAYAKACEQAMGLVPTPEVARARTILLELERSWNHLNDIAAICAGVGLAAGNNLFAALTEQMRRLNAELAGHRFLFGSVRLGGSALVLEADVVRGVRERLASVRAQAAVAWHELLFNASFEDRLPDVGVLTVSDVERLGTVGPAARAAGVANDVRATSPELAYDGFTAVVPERAGGDVQARIEQRVLELWQTFDLLDALLDRPLRPASVRSGVPEQSIGVGRVESARERLAGVRLRTGSYANWPSVAFAAAGNLLPDFPLINKSFELCYACADR
jgi:Ni,Fe-hydrogenase III large subunit